MKYHNKKVIAEGQTFDSQKEYRRYCELKILEKAGEIKDLRRQVAYTLLPTQRTPVRTEREVRYIADFVYTENGKTVIEDVKGVRTDAYKLKRKMMLYLHGICIKET